MFDKELERAKLDILVRSDCVFIASVLFSLEFKWDDTIQTACTNGKNLRINPAYFISMDKDIRVSLLLHEAYHVILKHMFRGKGKIHDKYNRAADYCINLMLQDMGLSLGKNWLIDSKYTNMSTEEIYHLLEDDDTECGEQYNDFEDAPEDMDEDEIDTVITRAANQNGVLPGNLPSEVQTILERINNPKVDWKTILFNYMSTFCKDDYSYTKPNIFYSPYAYLPSLHSSSIDEIAVFCDVSGSITAKQLQEFIDELVGINDMVKPKKISFHSFNTKLQDSYMFESGEPIVDVVFKVGGGTCIRCIANYVRKHDPYITVILTDGFFHLEDMSHCQNLVWLIHSNTDFTAPVGEVINYDISA